MEMVPDPFVENIETTCRFDRVGVCIELGEEAGIYSLIFFKNPGVFNSRSSK